ncbi:hypothetical protein JOF56_006964 [Kibdelosporangium banguiense]|uniref:DUF4878 domain-containing protein n=1 Tax=Kibdelosporangium banguiense TaxID=1365924 RepID=A0ABS4TQ96_9PSEU|nr:hypothetical protein [Kibdelosporangium banguiense]MBP2326579.1 hypothetical protein [Kibdelosporangium banguiense]
MSPKASRSADEPGDEPGQADLPPGYVRMSRPKPAPVSWWWKSAGLVVLLAAAVIAIMFIVKGPDPRESARGTAKLVAESLTDADMSDFRSYVCDSGKLEIPDAWTQMGSTSVLDVSSERDGVATATLTTTKRPDMDLVLLLHSKDEQWCVVVVTNCPRYLDAPSASSLPDVKGCRGRPGR